MPNALENLLARTGLVDTDGLGGDDLFDPLRAVEAVQVDQAELAALAGSAPAVPAPVSKKRKAEAATNVTKAMALLDPESTAAVGGAKVSPEPEGRIAEKPQTAEPVTRPNGQCYYPRTVGTNTDVAALREARSNELHVLLYGYPGTGKTSMLEAAFGDDLVTFEGHGDAEVSDLVGGYVQQPDRSYTWVDGPALVAAEQGKVLFVDDATLTPSTVLARLYPLMDGRGAIRVRENPERGEVRARRGFLVVGAHNPGVPGAVLSEALSSRFALQLEVSTDLQLARDMGVDHRMVRIAASLQKQRRDGRLTWAPEMRELLVFKTVSEVFGLRIAAANLLGLAPHEERQEVASIMRAWFNDLDALALGERA